MTSHIFGIKRYIIIKTNSNDERYKTLNEILAKNTGQSLKKIEKDTDRDYIMTPVEALEYGMIDKVVSMGEK